MQPDSDEENVIEQCPSPLPFNGSNAVSPDGEGSKPSFERQHQEQENANILKVVLPCSTDSAGQQVVFSQQSTLTIKARLYVSHQSRMSKIGVLQ